VVSQLVVQPADLGVRHMQVLRTAMSAISAETILADRALVSASEVSCSQDSADVGALGQCVRLVSVAGAWDGKRTPKGSVWDAGLDRQEDPAHKWDAEWIRVIDPIRDRWKGHWQDPSASHSRMIGRSFQSPFDILK
jgi:hypothetical protein